MVARDGIEPPTPAFSGPRSTTELSGLGMKRLQSGIAKNHRAPLSTSCHLSPQPFQGSLSPAGNRQRKRILSIAISSHHAKWPPRDILFSSCIAKDAHAPTPPDLSCRASSLPAYCGVCPDSSPVFNEDNRATR